MGSFNFSINLLYIEPVPNKVQLHSGINDHALIVFIQFQLRSLDYSLSKILHYQFVQSENVQVSIEVLRVHFNNVLLSDH